MGACATPGVRRGCGTRVQGGVYLEVGLSSSGTPLEHFFIDPPLPMTVDTKVGVELIERNGVVHVLDWIGSESYPYASDFLEEGSRHGFSRRVSKGLDFSRLSEASRLLLVHAKGLVVNHRELLWHGEEELNDPIYAGGRLCAYHARTRIEAHFDLSATGCIRDLWALPIPDDVETRGGKTHYRRKVGDFSYRVLPLGPEAPEVVTTSALIASLPITNISVIKADDGSHSETTAKLRRLLEDESGALHISVTEQDG